MSVLGLEGVRAVSFDVGGTLLEPWPSVGVVYAETLERVTRAKVEPELLSQRFHAAWKARGAFDYSRDAWRRLVVATFRDTGAPDVDELLFEAIFRRFESPGAWRMYSDAGLALEMLSDLGIPILIISNWDQRLRTLLEAMELADGFASITISCEVEAHKPSPEIFARAAESVGLTPREVLHVGDSYDEDYQGALNAGFQARWLSREGGADGERLDSIRELTELIPFDRAPTIALPSRA